MSFGPVRILLLLVALLAGGLAWLWVDEHAKPRNLAWVAPAGLKPDLSAPASLPQANASAANPAQYLAVLERPLFAPDRRPPPPPAPPPPPDPMANIQIHGIFSGASPGIIANVDGKLRRVKVNEAIGAWTLKGIEGREVTFGQGDESRQIHLAYAPLGPRVLPTAVAPTGGGQVPVNSAPASLAPSQNIQDESRAYLRRRNEARAARGLPLITE